MNDDRLATELPQQTCQVSRISRETRAFSMSLTLSLRTVEISRVFLLNEKTIFLMSQVFSFCGEKLEYTYVRLIDSVLYFIW